MNLPAKMVLMRVVRRAMSRAASKCLLAIYKSGLRLYENPCDCTMHANYIEKEAKDGPMFEIEA